MRSRTGRVAARLSLALLLALGAATPLAGARLARAQDDSEKKEEPKGDANPERRFAGQIVDFLRSELDLSPEQVTKVNHVMDEGLKEAMKMMFKRMAEDEPDPEERKKDEAAIRQKILGDIREVLDETQKREFDSLVKDFESRAGKFERGQNQIGGDAALWFEGEHPSRDSLLTHAEAALILSQDEHAAIFPKVEKVVDARLAVRELIRSRRKDLSIAAHGGARNEEIRTRLHDLRRQENEAHERLERAEAELRELITVDQEARLVALGIMD